MRVPAGVASPIFTGAFRTHGRTNLAGISLFGEMVQHSWFYEFDSCALCREVSRRELFAKIQSLPLGLQIILFKSLPEIHDHR